MLFERKRTSILAVSMWQGFDRTRTYFNIDGLHVWGPRYFRPTSTDIGHRLILRRWQTMKGFRCFLGIVVSFVYAGELGGLNDSRGY